MIRFIARRLLQMIPVLWLVITITFVMVRLAPGGPFSTEKKIPEAILKKLEAHYGLDRPLMAQYFAYLGNVLRGDLGPSFKYEGRSVNELIAAAFPISLELGCYALAVALVLGLSAGLLASLRPNSITDYLPMSVAMLGICIPTFVMGPLLLLVFGLMLNWFNVSGWDVARDKVLPALTLGGYYAAYVARLTRGGVIEILSHDFIRTARAKGAGPARILFKHALKGGLLPVVSYLGPAVAGLLTGSFVVELIFQIPGLGRFFIQSAFNRDYTLVLGTVIFYATLIILFNLAVDVIQVWLNPKLRLA
jgi:oligopeptide transport system permease protein